MIQTPKSISDITAALSEDFLSDKTPLRTSAGFAAESPFAGQPRQTFSLPLSETTIKEIRRQVQGLYDEIIKDCWPKGEPIPFDMLRFDAFVDPENNELKILEINTRNVGLHEVVEWLDACVAEALGVAKQGSLNARFVKNQKTLHGRLFDADEPLLYMSPAFLPKWTYFEELQKAYSKVTHITSAKMANYTEQGIEVDGYTYKAITKKLAWAATDTLKRLDLDNQVRVLQPRWMRPFGLKHYLQQLSSPTILRTETYTDEHAESYIANKDNLVLKIIDGGNSKAVYLGGMLTQEQWERRLHDAAQMPEKWIIQDYYQPPKMDIVGHGIGGRQLPTQLGVFVLPCPDDPMNFDMDITAKAFAGQDQHFTFDPSGLNPDIWFGHVVKIND